MVAQNIFEAGPAFDGVRWDRDLRYVASAGDRPRCRSARAVATQHVIAHEALVQIMRMVHLANTSLAEYDRPVGLELVA